MRQRLYLALFGLALLAPKAAGAADVATPDAAAPHHVAVDAGPAETKDQRAFRIKYVSDTSQKETALLKDLVWTPEVHKAVNEHWRRAYRSLRIRELAEDSADADTVARCDTYLRKIDGHFFGYLAELAPTLPTIAAAPTIAAPATGAKIPIGSALTITVTPAPNVTPTEYFIVASEGSASLSNYDSAGKTWGAQPTVTFAANDPKWAKFVAKKGGIWVATGTKAKSPKGVDYMQWSHQRYVAVQYVAAGGAQ